MSKLLLSDRSRQKPFARQLTTLHARDVHGTPDDPMLAPLATKTQPGSCGVMQPLSLTGFGPISLSRHLPAISWPSATTNDWWTLPLPRF